MCHDRSRLHQGNAAEDLSGRSDHWRPARTKPPGNAPVCTPCSKIAVPAVWSALGLPSPSLKP
jgi:hypothetical protein